MFGNFYCGSFEPSYIHISLLVLAGSPNELMEPPAAAAAAAPKVFLESGARTKSWAPSLKSGHSFGARQLSELVMRFGAR